jgi:hypothetical protein
VKRKLWYMHLERPIVIQDPTYGPATVRARIEVAFRPGSTRKDVTVKWEGLRADFSTGFKTGSTAFMTCCRVGLQRAYLNDVFPGASNTRKQKTAGAQ